MNITRVVIVALIGLGLIGCAQVVITFVRRPARIELVGADLSLYGYGAAVGLLFSSGCGIEVLPNYTSDFPSVLTFVYIVLFFSVVFYGVNSRFLARRIRRRANGFAEGVNDDESFLQMWEDRGARRLWLGSLFLGLIPSLSIASLIVLFS